MTASIWHLPTDFYTSTDCCWVSGEPALRKCNALLIFFPTEFPAEKNKKLKQPFLNYLPAYLKREIFIASEKKKKKKNNQQTEVKEDDGNGLRQHVLV